MKIKNHALAVFASISGVLISGFFTDRLYFELFYWLLAISAYLTYEFNNTQAAKTEVKI
jgi:hypothetical protein